MYCDTPMCTCNGIVKAHRSQNAKDMPPTVTDKINYDNIFLSLLS